MIEALKEVNKHYISIVYTASHKIYADSVIDYFDPTGELIKYRLYRNNCIRTKMLDEFIYVKDLRIFKNVDLKDIIIIDNSVLSFVFQFNNGIPILPFYDDKQDIEFNYLVKYLKHLSTFDDIGQENKKLIPLDFFKKKANNEKYDIDPDEQAQEQEEAEDNKIKVENLQEEEKENNDLKDYEAFKVKEETKEIYKPKESNNHVITTDINVNCTEDQGNFSQRKFYILNILGDSNEEDEDGIEEENDGIEINIDVLEDLMQQKLTNNITNCITNNNTILKNDFQKIPTDEFKFTVNNTNNNTATSNVVKSPFQTGEFVKGIIPFNKSNTNDIEIMTRSLSNQTKSSSKPSLIAVKSTYFEDVPLKIKFGEDNLEYSIDESISNTNSFSESNEELSCSDEDALNNSDLSYEKHIIIKTNLKHNQNYEQNQNNYNKNNNHVLVYLNKGLVDNLKDS